MDKQCFFGAFDVWVAKVCTPSSSSEMATVVGFCFVECHVGVISF